MTAFMGMPFLDRRPCPCRCSDPCSCPWWRWASSQWVFVTRGDISKVEDLKGKTIGYGRLGSADYDEGATYLARFYNLQVGKDYKVLAFQGEPERVPALLNKDIDATLLSAAHAAQ